MTLRQCACFSIPRRRPSDPGRHRHPRGRAPVSCTPVLSSAKERARSTPNSASGGRRKEPSSGFVCLCPRMCSPSFSTHELEWFEFFVYRHGLLHARRATGLTGRDKERGKLGPDGIDGEMVASAASHVRGWHARISQQTAEGRLCVFLRDTYVGTSLAARHAGNMPEQGASLGPGWAPRRLLWAF